jgi:hypothetical protein
MKKKYIFVFVSLFIILVAFQAWLVITGHTWNPAIRHFRSPSDKNMGIEFDYPATWDPIVRRNAGTINVLFLEPGQPTPPPASSRPYPSDEYLYEMTIATISVYPDQQMDQVLELRLQGLQNPNPNLKVQILRNESVEVDGYSGWMIARKFLAYEDAGQEYFVIEKELFVQLPNRYYLVYAYFPDYKEGGEFDQAYQELIQTLVFK